MSHLSRHDVLKTAVGTTALLAASGVAPQRAGAAPRSIAPPEPNAQLRVVRSKQFVQGDIKAFTTSTKPFTELTGIKVRIDTESWEDVRRKAAAAANVGTGPDIIIGTNDDPHEFPEKLLPLNDLADCLGSKYGGDDVGKAYGTRGDDFVALPQGVNGVNGSCINSGISAPQRAGFDRFPPGSQTERTPGRVRSRPRQHLDALALVARREGRRRRQQDGSGFGRDRRSARESQTACRNLRSGHAVVAGKAFLSGDISLTGNGISMHTVAKTSKAAALQAIAKDMDHAADPAGLVGHPTEAEKAAHGLHVQIFEISQCRQGLFAVHAGGRPL